MVLMHLKENTLLQDADLEYDPSEFENFVKIFDAFDADIIFGSRMRIKIFKVIYFLLVGNKITLYFNILYSALSQISTVVIYHLRKN